MGEVNFNPGIRRTPYGNTATHNAGESSKKQMPIPKTAKLDTTMEMPNMGTVEVYKSEIKDNTGKVSGHAFYIKNNIYMPIEVKSNITGENIQTGIKQITLPARQAGQDGTSLEAFVISPQNKSKSSNWKCDSQFQIGSSNGKHDPKVSYKLPFSGTRTVTQGENGKLTHTGNHAFAIDFAMPEGAEVLSIRDGIVVAVKKDSKEGGGLHIAADKANYIYVYHPDDGSIAKYAHLKENGTAVKLGQKVKAGELIGFSGNTGKSNAPHLHLQVDVPKGFSDGDLISIRFQGAKGEPFKVEEGKSYSNPR